MATLELDWTPAEKLELLNPAVEFNPPVRFLQTTGHRSAVGIELDRINLKIEFTTKDAQRKFKHLVRRLVVDSSKGLGATSSYKDVFADYVENAPISEKDSPSTPPEGSEGDDKSSVDSDETPDNTSETTNEDKSPPPKLAKGALFNYPVTSNSALHQQLMKEAKSLNTNNFPAAGTALLRCILETILKSIIHDQGANPESKLLSLETSLGICLSNGVKLSPDDKKTLKEFNKNHLDYMNLGAHGTIIPNHLRLMSARDCIDQFVMRNI